MDITRGINHIGLTVPDIEAATQFFKAGLDGKVAYDSQTEMDPLRGGKAVERFLDLEQGAKIIKKRMMVFGNGPNIEMFEFVNAHQHKPSALQDIGFTHISFYVDDFDKALHQIIQAGGEPVSEPHENTRYEDTLGNQTIYIKAPWGSLIELQTLPHGYYYPKESEAEVFIPKE
ncbi:VOC family protein [Staphylococcus simulans]|uniref:VOC family protein n=1 Tax=Staphylococcus simulans TaxID=1286 RepID=UPI003F7F19DC